MAEAGTNSAYTWRHKASCATLSHAHEGSQAAKDGMRPPAKLVRTWDPCHVMQASMDPSIRRPQHLPIEPQAPRIHSGAVAPARIEEAVREPCGKNAYSTRQSLSSSLTFDG